MVKLIAFDTEEELMELTGISEDELWKNGFELDDWDIGFQTEVKLHADPTQEDLEEEICRPGELLALYRLPAHWLMMKMNNYCIGVNYVFLD